GQGATVELLPRFDPDEVWSRFARLRVTIFMGVPTMYVRLIRTWKRLPHQRGEIVGWSAGDLRLTISGSAALPARAHQTWREITGQGILERYGLSETGMVLTGPLKGPRAEGHVGHPFPSVQVRLRGDGGGEAAAGEEGCIEVRGPGLFREYWRRPEETAAAFRDGWFDTGDRAVRNGPGGYRILGRESVDIIKTGGEKVSALEIEDVLLRHLRISDCAVVGIPHDEWGEQVSAAVVLTEGLPLPVARLRVWVKDFLAGYKAPARFLVVDDLPRNSMGKVLKDQVRDLFLQAP
ncbi:MAG: AMP-binding protein, partial [Gammaproteobacteria bacterium]|nr:AMP-binding protein [Gammaproteobacteria bacterium]